jgi:preprotein translocase subunit SecD
LGIVLLLFGFVLAGCQAAASGDTQAAASGRNSVPSAPGQVALTVPVEVRQVLATAPCTAANSAGNLTPPVTSASSTPIGTALSGNAAPATLHDVDGVDCYQVSAPLLVLQQLNSINVSSQPPTSQWVITMTMTQTNTQSFAAVTEQHAGQQFAFVVRDTVLSAQTIPQPITNGVVQIAGNFSQDDANRLMRQITG